MDVNVVVPHNDRTLSVSVQHSDDVNALRRSIASALGSQVGPGDFKLVHAGRLIEDACNGQKLTEIFAKNLSVASPTVYAVVKPGVLPPELDLSSKVKQVPPTVPPPAESINSVWESQGYRLVHVQQIVLVNGRPTMAMVPYYQVSFNSFLGTNVNSAPSPTTSGNQSEGTQAQQVNEAQQPQPAPAPAPVADRWNENDLDDDELEEFEAAMNPGAPAPGGAAAANNVDPRDRMRDRFRLRGIRLALRLLLFVFIFGHGASTERFISLSLVACIAWLWQTRRLDFVRSRFTGVTSWIQTVMFGQWGFGLGVIAAMIASLHPEAAGALRAAEEEREARLRQIRAEAEAAAAAAAAAAEAEAATSSEAANAEEVTPQENPSPPPLENSEKDLHRDSSEDITKSLSNDPVEVSGLQSEGTPEGLRRRVVSRADDVDT